LNADTPSYLVLDDCNKVAPDRLYDFDGLDPVGALSARFLETCARRFLQAVAERRPVRGVTRG
jgi:hypothetical protein